MIADIRFYAILMLRRLPLIIIIGGMLSAGAVAFVITRPAIYSASALLLVEGPRIPNELAATTVSNDAPVQLEIIEQRLLSRETVLNIADDLGVFPDRSEMVPDDVVEAMRWATSFQRSFGRSQATTLRISFKSEDPEIAARVANEYTTRVLRENNELRTGIAEETLSFFQQEVERLGQELDRQNARILEFQNANLDALPASMDYRLSRQSILLERRAQTEREQTILREQRRRLVDIFETTGQIDGPNRTPDEERLKNLRDELNNALLVFSPQNPRIRVLQAQVDALEEEVAAQRGANPRDSENPQQDLLEAQLSEIDARDQLLGEQIALIDTELASIEESIARTPSNAITLESLQRDYENLRMQYDTAIARLAAAATGERIELTARGQRFSVLQQATVPREPDSPNRTMLVLIGVIVSFGLAGTLALGLELLNRSIRRPVDLVRALDITPLGTVPYLPTRGEIMLRRGLLIGTVAIFAIAVPAALYFVHMQVMPLEQLAARAMQRIGL